MSSHLCSTWRISGYSGVFRSFLLGLSLLWIMRCYSWFMIHDSWCRWSNDISVVEHCTRYWTETEIFDGICWITYGIKDAENICLLRSLPNMVKLEQYLFNIFQLFILLTSTLLPGNSWRDIKDSENTSICLKVTVIGRFWFRQLFSNINHDVSSHHFCLHVSSRVTEYFEL